MASRTTGIPLNYRLTLPEAAVARQVPRFDLQALVAFALMPLQQAAGPQGRPFLTDSATGTEDSIANISSLARTFMPESAPTQLLGFTTCVNAFQGWWAAKKAKMRFEAASKIHDRGGMIEGGIDTVRGASQSLGGVAYVGSRGAMFANDLGAVNPCMAAVAPSSWVAGAFGTLGNICFTIFYVMVALWSGYGLRKDLQFGAALHTAGKDVALFRFLRDRTCADPKKKLATADKDKLQKTALDALTGQFLFLQKQGQEAAQLSASEARDLLKNVFAAQDGALRASCAWNHYIVSLGLPADDPHLRGFSTLELIGFRLEEMKRQRKNQAKFARVTDGGCVEAVQKAARMGLEQRLVSSEPLIKEAASQELEALKTRVISANGKATRVHAALLAIGSIGAAVSVVGFFALTHPVVIALAALAVLVNIGLMMVTDGCFLKESWDNGPAGIHDKKYLATIATLLVFVIGASLSVTLGFGLPLLPCIAACAVGGIGLMLTGYSYHKVVQKEKKWRGDHPDLKTFRDVLAGKRGQEALDEESMRLFKKLPKTERHLIREKYLGMSRRGEMAFKTPGYLLLDREHDFGGEFQWSGQAAAQTERPLLVRGIKKMVKSCWNDYEKDRNEQNRTVALRMQALHDSIVREERWEESLQKIRDVQRIPGLRNALNKNVWYVVKREENTEDLKRAVAAAMEQVATPANPLSEHLITALTTSAA